MIVYPAYVYMGKEPPVPDFPFGKMESLKYLRKGLTGSFSSK